MSVHRLKKSGSDSMRRNCVKLLLNARITRGLVLWTHEQLMCTTLFNTIDPRTTHQFRTSYQKVLPPTLPQLFLLLRHCFTDTYEQFPHHLLLLKQRT